MCRIRDAYLTGFETGFKQVSEGRKSLLHPRLKSHEYIHAPYIRGMIAGMRAAEVYAAEARDSIYLVIPRNGHCVFCLQPELYMIPEMFRKKPTVVIYPFPPLPGPQLPGPQLPVPSSNALRVPSLRVPSLRVPSL